MKIKATKKINLLKDAKLSRQQMNIIKGGDDDILLNNGDLGGLNFGG